MLQHLKALQKQVTDNTGTATLDIALDTSTTKTITREPVIDNMKAMDAALRGPFKDADTSHDASVTPSSVTATLRKIWETLQSIETSTCDDGVTTVPTEVSRFVATPVTDPQTGSTIAPPDGSATVSYTHLPLPTKA